MNPRKSVRNTFSEGTETQQLCLGRSRIIQITEAAIQTEGQLWLIYIWRNCVGNLQTETASHCKETCAEKACPTSKSNSEECVRKANTNTRHSLEQTY